MIDQFQAFLLLGVTLLLVFIVIRMLQSDLRETKPSPGSPAGLGDDVGDRPAMTTGNSAHGLRADKPNGS
jgi:hypothetical protein